MGDLILISSWNLQWEAVTVTSSISPIIPESLTMGTRTGIGGFCALGLNSYLKLRSRHFILLSSGSAGRPGVSESEGGQRRNPRMRKLGSLPWMNLEGNGTQT